MKSLEGETEKPKRQLDQNQPKFSEYTHATLSGVHSSPLG